MATTNLPMLCSMVLAILSVAIQADQSGSDSQLRIERTSDDGWRFRFYLQDRTEGPNQTVWEVARANITANSGTLFGLVTVGDDLITVAPYPGSKKMGRAQGMLTSADLHEQALHLNVNMYFTWPRKLNGSSLIIMGRNALSEKDKELAIVGGTGVFRMARGYAFSNTYFYDHGHVIGYQVFVYLGEEQHRQLASS